MTATRTLSQIDAEIKATKEALENVHGSETEVYARIVGYYRSVRNWNKGKRDEFDSRKMFKVEDKSYEITSADTACACSSYSRVEASANTDGIARYELFARTTCPNCPPVKSYIAGVDVPGTIIDVDSADGLAIAAKKGVLAAPTVIVYDAADNEIARAHNVDELVSIFEPVAVTAAV